VKRAAADTGRERHGERNAVAVTLLLLFVLGTTGSTTAGAPAAVGRAVAVRAVLLERGVAVRERRCEVRCAAPSDGGPQRIEALGRPRSRRPDGHAWPPPRGP
jgi:hypothetical protein